MDHVLAHYHEPVKTNTGGGGPAGLYRGLFQFHVRFADLPGRAHVDPYGMAVSTAPAERAGGCVRLIDRSGHTHLPDICLLPEDNNPGHCNTLGEINTVLGDDLPGPETISRLHYIEQIIKETLRLYPPIHAANRETNSDLNLQGCPVERGRRVMFSYYLTHRDERVWDDPEHFNPQRFEKGKSRMYDSFSYLPFGGGPRNCIGAAFAQNEAKIILARILQSVDFELTHFNIKIHMGATLEPRPGVMMRILPRNNNVEHSTQIQNEIQHLGNTSV